MDWEDLDTAALITRLNLRLRHARLTLSPSDVALVEYTRVDSRVTAVTLYLKTGVAVTVDLEKGGVEVWAPQR